jgi:hypothetical protein
MFRVRNLNGTSNSIYIQGSYAEDKTKDIAGITLANYDLDTSNYYNMAAMSMRDHYGDSSNNGYGDLLFLTNINGSNLTEKMRILYDGKVGIGTSNPTHKLDIAGDLNLTGNFLLNNQPILNGSNLYVSGYFGVQTSNNVTPVDIAANTTFRSNIVVYQGATFCNSESVFGTFMASNNANFYGPLIASNNTVLAGTLTSSNVANFYGPLTASNSITFAGPFVASNSVTIYGELIASNIVYVYNTEYVNDQIVNSNLIVDDNLWVGQNTTLSNGLSNLGNAYFASNVTVNSNLNVNQNLFVNQTFSNFGNAYFASNAVVNSNLNINQKLFVNQAVTHSNSLSNLGNAYFASNVSINSNLSVLQNVNVSQSLYVNQNVTFSNTLSNLGNIYAASNAYIGGKLGIGVLTPSEALSVASNISLSNYGKAVLWTSNNYLGINTSNPRTNVEIRGGDFLGKNIVRKTISTDSSNNLIITLNWENAYNSGNQYYVVVETCQTITNGTLQGVRYQRQTIRTSNTAIITQQAASSYGNAAAFSSLTIAGVNATSTSIGLQSSTNWATSGTMVHNLDANVIIMPQTSNLGNIWLT